MKYISQSRREFLTIVSRTGLLLSAAGVLNACSPQLTRSSEEASTFVPDVEIDLRAVQDDIQILDGEKTSVWRYIAQLLQGPENAIQTIPGSYLGPIFHFRRGQNVRIQFHNEITEETIVHWHGLHVPDSADGHPRLVIAPGETYTYQFKVIDRAGTYWFHPHPHGRTGPQVMKGLAGLLIVHDEEDDGAGLPTGEFDLPLVIQDRSLSSDNQFLYQSSGMMGQMVGFLGDQIFVNGKPQMELPVATRPYRLRILNGSNARIYKLGWQDGRPLIVIGTDGGLLEAPLSRDYVSLAPGQRVDLWADFSQDALGSRLWLQNFEDSTPGSADFSLLSVLVEREADSTLPLPQKLSTPNYLSEGQALNYTEPRTFELAMGMGMQWTINSRTFEMEKVARDERVKLGDIEEWRFRNPASGNMGILLPHPMHIHGLQFQIVERIVADRYRPTWSTVSAGFVDEGWHDTVLVMPGEEVRLLMKFEDYEGLYLYHCHNLEHEDMGMMRNYRVE